MERRFGIHPCTRRLLSTLLSSHTLYFWGHYPHSPCRDHFSLNLILYLPNTLAPGGNNVQAWPVKLEHHFGYCIMIDSEMGTLCSLGQV